MDYRNMANENLWSSFGFRENPYGTRALSSEEGNRLLVGRETEVKWLTMQLTSISRVPVLTGHNGVGKTSIANVVAYRLSHEYRTENQRYFVLELNKIKYTQLTDLETFEQNLYKGVINLLLKERTFLQQRGVESTEINDVEDLLKKMIYTEGGGGFGPVSLNYGRTPNPSSEQNLIEVAQQWLNKCFCAPNTGGIICIIDNLENNGTSNKVQEIIERMRDTLFSTPGLLWVLCGTQVVANGALTSSLLNGYLSECKIEPIDEINALELMRRRIEYYGKEDVDPPVDERLFKFIYEIVVNKQLRDALKLCEDFAQHLYINTRRQTEDRSEELKLWLNQKIGRLPNRLNGMSDKVWSFFDNIADFGGEFTSTDYRFLGITSEDELEKVVLSLIKNSLLVKIPTDEGYLLRVTETGWLVNYRRRQHDMN